MRLGALFLVLVAVNVYVFFFRSGTSIRDVLKTSAIKAPGLDVKATEGGKVGLTAHSSDEAPPEGVEVVKGTLGQHNGLLAALAARGLKSHESAKVVKSLRGVLNMRALRPEHRLELHRDSKTREVQRFIYHLSPVVKVEVRRRADGTFKARRMEAKLDTRVVRLVGKIDTSLNRAITSKGGSSAVVAKFTRLFDWDINWYTDPRDGDEFRIVVEKKFLAGKLYGFGRILAAEYKGRVGRFQVYFFEHGKTSGHYTPEGRSIRRALLKTPLHYRRISSKYNRRRFHPVLHRTKGHFGVDYAAARGTPIWAAGDGKVVTARRAGGAGKMVVLRHAAGVTTLYMHLSRFARGLKAGMTVKQRQLIGTVGSTGLATGPHLHYGVKVRGRHVDPLRYNVGKGPLLPRAARIRFLDRLADRMAKLEGLKIN